MLDCFVGFMPFCLKEVVSHCKQDYGYIKFQWYACCLHFLLHCLVWYQWVGVGSGHLQPCEWVLESIYGHHRGCLNNPIFLNLGLCAVCWAHFMCHHELWPTSVSHPFSSLNSSLGFDGGKHYQKIAIPIFRLVLQNLAIPICFPYIIFYRYHFSSLSCDWFVIAVCGSISVQGTT